MSSLEALFASFECELACLSPSIFVVFVFIRRLVGGLSTTFQNETAAVIMRELLSFSAVGCDFFRPETFQYRSRALVGAEPRRLRWKS